MPGDARFVPSWIHEVAVDMADALPLWVEQAERGSEVEDRVAAGRVFLIGVVEHAIAEAWRNKASRDGE